MHLVPVVLPDTLRQAMASVSTVSFRISPSAGVPPTFMSASANGWTIPEESPNALCASGSLLSVSGMTHIKKSEPPFEIRSFFVDQSFSGVPPLLLVKVLLATSLLWPPEMAMAFTVAESLRVNASL